MQMQGKTQEIREKMQEMREKTQEMREKMQDNKGADAGQQGRQDAEAGEDTGHRMRVRGEMKGGNKGQLSIILQVSVLTRIQSTQSQTVPNNMCLICNMHSDHLSCTGTS